VFGKTTTFFFFLPCHVSGKAVSIRLLLETCVEAFCIVLQHHACPSPTAPHEIVPGVLIHRMPNSKGKLHPTSSHEGSEGEHRLSCTLFLASALDGGEPPVQWVPGLSRGYRRPGRDADHTPPSSAEVKKELSYTSTHPMGPPGPVTRFLLPLPGWR
jgi:hypothetical protein